MKAGATDAVRSRCLYRRSLVSARRTTRRGRSTDVGDTVGLVPALFWFETRNLFLVAERRGRLRAGEPILLMTQLRGLPLEDAGSSGDGLVLELAARYTLTAYDASYVALARTQGLPLATGDRKMANAARSEGITVVGPLEHEH